ncbi:hypothetical protein APHAL10511_006954 [Amanita phalloides]|nr:hypothetical protein APHAL10511_006954 [Amanita phalloides]
MPAIMSGREVAKDVALGSVAGMVAAVLEYPLDLAKVRLQAQLLFKGDSGPFRFNGPWHCLVQTWKYEGIRGLYRGLPAPVVGAMAETAAIFVSYSYFQNLIRAVSLTGKDSSLTIPQLALAAGGAGFVTSFVLTPIELVKCRMQVQMMNMYNYMDPPSTRNLSTSAAHAPKPTLIFPARVLVNGLATAPATSPAQGFTSDAKVFPGTKPQGLWRITMSIVHAHGLRGLWLGHTSTMLRETGGSSIWFSIKEWTAAWLRERRRGDGVGFKVPRKGNDDLLPWESALAGALAGAVSTLLLYPADTVKSAIQTEGELRPRLQPSSATVPSIRTGSSGDTLVMVKRMYDANGLKGFYSGCGMTIARAVPERGISGVYSATIEDDDIERGTKWADPKVVPSTSRVN